MQGSWDSVLTLFAFSSQAVVRSGCSGSSAVRSVQVKRSAVKPGSTRVRRIQPVMKIIKPGIQANLSDSVSPGMHSFKVQWQQSCSQGCVGASARQWSARGGLSAVAHGGQSSSQQCQGWCSQPSSARVQSGWSGQWSAVKGSQAVRVKPGCKGA